MSMSLVFASFRRVIPIVFLMLMTGFCAHAQFPYLQTFKNTTAPGVVFGGNPIAFLTASKSVAYISGGNVTDPSTEGYLRLTNNSTSQRGYIYSNTPFPSTYGIKATVEYYTYGGNGADGLSFFLFDATITDQTFNIGGFGGSLGYAQRLNGSTLEPGVSSGYIGIGFDEYGNFAAKTEDKGSGGGASIISNSVCVRGKGNGYVVGTGTSPAKTHTNYNYITHVQTSSPPASTFAAFNIASGGATVGRITSTTDANYRKLYVELKPAVSPATGYLVSVAITHGTVTDTVIKGAAYTEIAPANLKFGIGSSTGSVTNFHEVRNVNIDVYDPSPLGKPIAKNASATVCANTPVVIDVLSSATLVNAPFGVNNQSVRFIDNASGAKLSSITIPGKGTFSANDQVGSDGKVTFTAVSGFTGSAIIQYVFSDNYGRESTVATVLVTAVDGGPVAPVISSVATTGPTTCTGTNGVIRLNGLLANKVYTVNYSKDGTSATPVSITSDASGVVSITGLASGIFTSITVNDGTCPSAPVTATLSAAPVFTTAVTTNPTCSQTNGVITLSGLPASVSYTLNYLYNGIATASTAQTSNVAGIITISSLSPGNYTGITLTQGTCISAPQSVVMTGVSTPPAVTSAASVSPTTCGGNGSIVVNGSGFSGNYTVYYVKNGGALTTVNTVAPTNSTTIIIPSLTAGSYTNITIKSAASNCISSPLSATIADPVAPTFTLAATGTANCTAATGTITINGLLAANTYLLTVYKNGTLLTPLTSATATSGATRSYAISGLTAGAYEVSVQENGGSGCTSAPQTINVAATTGLTITATVTSPMACGTQDGSIAIASLTAGTTYNISYTKNSGTPVTASYTAAGGGVTLSGLGAGTYAVTAMANCTSAPVTVTLKDYPTFTLTTTSPASCTGNSGALNFSGLKASTPYYIDYVFGGVNYHTAISSSATGTLDISSLAAGSYSNITATIRAGGCGSLPSSAVLTSTACPDISGKVYNTPNGVATASGVTAGTGATLTGLYINLLDRTTYAVVKTVAVTSSGANAGEWSLTDVPPGNYILSLTNTATSATADLPAGYANTGEGIGAAVITGTPKGQQNITVTDQPITSLNFGIDKRPVTDAITNTIASTFFTSTAATGFPTIGSYYSIATNNSAFSGNGRLTALDDDDCAVTRCSTGATFAIERLYAGTRVFYNFGTGAVPDVKEVIPNTTTAKIPNYDPAMMRIYGLRGSQQVGFDYTMIDKASIQSATPAAYVINITGAPLPVTLVSFEAAARTEQVQLTWLTGQEQSMDYYTIERAADGSTFNTLATINATGNAQQSYELYDSSPLSGMNYYRLSGIELNGKTAHLGVRTINFSRKDIAGSFHVYPNPSNGLVIGIGFDGGVATASSVQVTSITGQEVYHATLAVMAGQRDYQLVFNEKLPPGLYIVKLISGASVYCQKVRVR